MPIVIVDDTFSQLSDRLSARSFSGYLRRDRRHRRQPSARQGSDALCPEVTPTEMPEAESAWAAGN